MRALERIEYRQGDLLRARDLAADAAGDDRRHALHVRSVHDTFGIALGFAVGLTDDRTGAVVGPGFAYDRCGLPIVSTGTYFVPAPKQPDTYDLVAVAECGRVRFRWSAPDTARADELVLARATFGVTEYGERLSDPDIGVRRAARGLQGGIRAGRFVGSTSWSSLEASLTVPTGGFETTPFYLATLEAADLPAELIGPFLEIREQEWDSFLLVIRFAVRGWLDTSQARATLAAQYEQIAVSWIGVEPPGRFGLEPDLEELVSVTGGEPPNPDEGIRFFEPVPPDPDPTRTF